MAITKAALVALLLAAAVVLAGCRAPWSPPAPPPQPPVTLLYVDVTRSSANANAMAAMARNLEAVLDQVLLEHGRLIVDVIDENPLAHAQVVADVTLTAPEAHGNPLSERKRVCARWSQAQAAVGTALARPRPSRWTDVFGALTSSGQRLQALPTGARRRVVFLSDMMSTAPGRNLPVRSWDQGAIDQLIDGLRADHELPALDGVDVWVGGVGLTDGVSAAKILELRTLWLAVLKETGALVRVFGPDLFATATPSLDCRHTPSRTATSVTSS
jgi:hypothetical protein